MTNNETEFALFQSNEVYIIIDELIKNKYDLSINRYKEIVYEEEEYEEPLDIISNSLKMNEAIINELEEIKKYISV